MKDYLLNIIKRLEDVQKKKNLVSAFRGFLLFLFILILSFLFFILLETLFHFISPVRTVFFILLSAGNLITLIYLVLYPLLKTIPPFFKIDLYKLAGETGNHFPGIKDNLLNAIQLLNDETTSYSRELIQAAFKDVYDKTSDIDFTSVIHFRQKRLMRISLITFVTGIIFIFALFPMRSAAYRLVQYNEDFKAPLRYSFNIQPGNAEITKGEDIDIIITAANEQPKSITFMSKTKEHAGYETTRVFPDSAGRFVNKLTSLNSSLKYYVEAEDVQSDTYEITVIDRPIISKFEITINPPSYSRLPKVTQKDNGSAEVLPGTSIDFAIESTKPLQSASLVLNDSVNIELSVNEETVSGRLNIMHNTEYYVSVTDKEGIENEDPILYTITTLEDQYPSIEITQPGKNMQLGLENALPLTVKINDDYGFSSLRLKYQFTSSNYTETGKEFESIDLPFVKSKKEQDVYYTWNLTALNLKAGDVISYSAEVADNDFVSGPKKRESKVYTLRVPELDELFANADAVQKSAETNLEKTLKEAEELSKEMKEINNSLKKDDREITWEEKENIEKALDKFESLQNKVEDIQKQLNEMSKDLSENKLLSEETLNNYMQLQDLMDQLSSEEMKAAMEKMREQMQSLMRDKVQDQMDNLQFDEEAFKKSVERTLNLLKRIQVEQKVDELIKRTEEMAKQMEELNKKTEQSDLGKDNKNEQLSSEQKSFDDDFEKMQDEMESLKDKMSELDNMPQEQAEQLLEQMKEQNNNELNEKTSQQLQQMQKSEAMMNQQQMMQNMQQQMEGMQNMQQSMQQQNQMKTLAEMVKITEDLIQLSKEQEKLKNNTANLPHNSPELQKNAEEQNNIKSSLNNMIQRMSSLSQQTFGITPEMGKAIGSSIREMNQSINSMQELNGSIAAQSQQKAMQGMNEAVVLMKNSINSMMSGGQGGGMMSLMQQLQQLGQKQMNLNQLTQMLNQGQLTQQQMAQLQRLTQEQGMIRKSLEQLNKEAKSAGESKKLGANLDKILEDMREVVSDMQNSKVNDNLVQKQERILSKLLDAQRSMNERDFEKNRESFTGKNVERESPPDLMLSTEEGRNKLRDELLNSVKEGYNKDYQELIKKYFEALEKESD